MKTEICLRQVVIIQKIEIDMQMYFPFVNKMPPAAVDHKMPYCFKAFTKLAYCC